jgi:hypothetical protein
MNSKAGGTSNGIIFTYTNNITMKNPILISYKVCNIIAVYPLPVTNDWVSLT